MSKRTHQGRLWVLTATIATVAALSAGKGFAAPPSVYVTNQTAASGSISILNMDKSGVLAQKSFNSTVTNNPTKLALTPDGHTLYLTDLLNGKLSTFTVHEDGTLTAKGTPVTTQQPLGIAVSPNGNVVYVINHNATGSIQAFLVQKDGQLNPAASSYDLMGAVAWPESIVVSPNGKSLYVTSATSANIGNINLNASGEFVAGSLSTVIAGSDSLTDLVLTPNGQHLYAIGGTKVQHLNINSMTGVLSIAAGGPVNAGTTPASVAVSPDGKMLYVTNSGSNTLSVFKVNDTNGDLTLNATVSTGRSPAGVAVSPDGHFVYVANYGGSSVSTFSVGQNQVLAELGLPVSGQNGAYDLVVSPATGPVAQFDAVSVAAAGSETVFDATGSAAASGSHISLYRWDFGDGQVVTSSEPRVTHTFATSGTFEVALTVVDSAACGTPIFTGKTMSCSALKNKPTLTQPVTISLNLTSIVDPAVTPAVTSTMEVPTRQCVVPNLSRVSLGVAKKRLAGAGCRLGKVKKPKKSVRHAKRAKLIVISQSRRRGLALAVDTKVDVTLGWRI